jgi:hypothetical protein
LVNWPDISALEISNCAAPKLSRVANEPGPFNEVKKGHGPRGRWPHCTMHSETFYFFLSWYRRSPPSLFVDSIRNPCFLAAVDRKPRTLCACHEVACQSRSLGSPDQRQDLASLALWPWFLP